MKQKNQEQYKVETEQRLTKVETLLNEIIINHLPHIESKLDRLLWFLVTTAFALASGFAFIIFKLQ